MNQNDKGMKKLITVIAATLMLLAPCFGQDNEVKISKKEIQEAGKQARAAEKILRKQGFKSFELGNATANLENYFLKVGSGCGSIVGTSTACISENLAKLTALANAANEYAVLQGGTVRGRIVSSASSLSGAQVVMHGITLPMVCRPPRVIPFSTITAFFPRFPALTAAATPDAPPPNTHISAS